MQRSFLEGLNLEKDTIDKIMDEHGKSVEGLKAKADGFKTQLATAQTALKSFEGVDVAELQGKITLLQNDLAAKEAAFNAQLADRDFNDKLAAAGKAAKVRDLEAVMPFLDVDALKASKNQDADISAAFDKVKQDKGYLFDGETPPKMVSFTGGTNEQTQSDHSKANNAIRSLFRKE